MTLEEYKSALFTGSVPEEFVIFKEEGNGFLTHNYKEAISKANSAVQFVQTIEEFISAKSKANLFRDDAQAVVFSCDEFVTANEELKNFKRAIVFCKKVNEDTAKLYEKFIIVLPTVQAWQVKDYVCSLLPGVEEKDIDKLLDICKSDPFRAEQEALKLVPFAEGERKYLFNEFFTSGALGDLSVYQIFDFTNAIIKKDITSLSRIYKEITAIDIEDIGVVTILVKGFKDIITVQLGMNPTPESTGMSSKKLAAIRYSINRYTKDQLIKIYRFLLDLDFKLKTGQLPTSFRDYVVTRILLM